MAAGARFFRMRTQQKALSRHCRAVVQGKGALLNHHAAAACRAFH